MDKPLSYIPRREIDIVIARIETLRWHLEDTKDAKTYEEINKYLVDAEDTLEDLTWDINAIYKLVVEKNFPELKNIHNN